ncbi:hypothetical protein A5664_30300 [Mycolicibacterium fortuitum]|uniref:DUF732 domain-containing protein n=1 Tax=Mycolicibacterium fortuitum TaxID=1766 RepID=UPI0007EE171E|nr:DUF732 domain-containing protein [Mycolicibacterium fortuitum]OBI73191.1 hypothetical protein A5664_30300 [Mycolicibacterium fortuitum]
MSATIVLKRCAYGLVAAALGVAALFTVPTAHADETAFLINVHVRPGYNFPNAQAALDYGHSICDRVAGGQPFGQVMGNVRADFNTDDDYQASYLIAQAVNELCPAQIWQLRRSAAHYQSPPGVHP